MIGKPKFKLNEIVKFQLTNDIQKIGKVYIIDKYGTFFDKSDVSYDIMVEEENCLYKHINEKYIIEKLS